MANEKIWAKRVEAWGRSGLSSIAFAEGKDFTGGGLRHMAYRLRCATAKLKPGPEAIRLARVRVVRAPVVAVVGGSSAAEVVIVIDAIRVEVNPGASREVLATVLEALRSGG